MRDRSLSSASCDDTGRIVIRRPCNKTRAERPGHEAQESRLRWFGHAAALAPARKKSGRGTLGHSLQLYGGGDLALDLVDLCLHFLDRAAEIEGNRFDRRACLVKIQKVRHPWPTTAFRY
jgi:hypothetical protein